MGAVARFPRGPDYLRLVGHTRRGASMRHDGQRSFLPTLLCAPRRAWRTAVVAEDMLVTVVAAAAAAVVATVAVVVKEAVTVALTAVAVVIVAAVIVPMPASCEVRSCTHSLIAHSSQCSRLSVPEAGPPSWRPKLQNV